MIRDIREVVAGMTLEEKASLCSGKNFWYLKGIERLGIPSIMMTDGPHGLRKQAGDTDNMGVTKSVPAVCFPTASALASSWDRKLIYEIGTALGEECLAEKVSVLLGPGINIKRSPLCGRNFEYFSEDPYLTGEMAEGMINGIQSKGIGTSLKHFAVNNQEQRRMTIDAIVDERALREIYLAGFEKAVKKASPWTVMCAYNKLGGVYCSENKYLLKHILREEWGFKGIVVTDWGACNNRVEGLMAGQELEMPSSNGMNDANIVKAVKNNELKEEVLNASAEKLLDLIFKAEDSKEENHEYDKEVHNTLARRAAAESMVLLKNEDSILPLQKSKNISVIGAFAKTPRYQGSGSSLINPIKLFNAYDSIDSIIKTFSYEPGYDIKIDIKNEELIKRACAAARNAEVAVIFAGLPDTYESEAMDRDHMKMPDSHNELIKRVAEVNPNTIVVLSNGAPVEMPWANSVKGILEGFLGGQASGCAVADVLFGAVNPSGKLAETFPIRLEDNPSYKYFPSGPKTVEYRESIYVGYRYYDSAKKPVLFPFGYGLSYTTFEYSNLKVSKDKILDNEELKVSIEIKNTGYTSGAEVVELYIKDVESTIFKPEKELKGFEKVFLEPGEMKVVEFTLDKRSFAYYNVEISDWHVESGSFEILIGASSADIRAIRGIWVDSTAAEVKTPDYRKTAALYYNLPEGEFIINENEFKALYGKEIPSNVRMPGEEYNINSPLCDLRETFIGRSLYSLVISTVKKTVKKDEDDSSASMLSMLEKFLQEMPVRNLVPLSNGMFTFAMVDALLLMMNRKRAKGFVKLSAALISKK
jgi:beta-glucosidase